PLVPREEREERVLVRRQLHGRACEGDGARNEIDPQVADLEHGLRRGFGPAERRAQPGQQLVDAERLRHVVVGAGVERCDLVLLVVDDRQDDDRHRAPAAQLARDVGAASIRENEVEDHGVRRTHGGARQRLLARRGRVDVVARSAQARLERAQDLRLVVDDEDARHAGTGAPTAAGSSTTKCAPPSAGSARSVPPFASTKPRAIARPRPAPPCSPSAWNGSKMRSRSAIAGPSFSTWIRTESADDSTRRRTSPSGGANLSALSSTFASTRSSCTPSTSTTGGSPSKVTRTRSPRLPSDSSARATSASAGQSSGCGAAAAARSRDRSRRLPTSRSSRSASSRIVAASSPRSASSSVTCGFERLDAAATIAVSG